MVNYGNFNLPVGTRPAVMQLKPLNKRPLLSIGLRPIFSTANMPNM